MFAFSSPCWVGSLEDVVEQIRVFSSNLDGHSGTELKWRENLYADKMKKEDVDPGVLACFCCVLPFHVITEKSQASGCGWTRTVR